MYSEESWASVGNILVRMLIFFGTFVLSELGFSILCLGIRFAVGCGNWEGTWGRREMTWVRHASASA